MGVSPSGIIRSTNSEARTRPPRLPARPAPKLELPTPASRQPSQRMSQQQHGPNPELPFETEALER